MNNILLAVTGLTPQVITKALYALRHKGREVHAVHVITTQSGRDRILTSLLAPVGGRLDAFLCDQGIAPESIDFGPQNVHVPCGEDGAEIDDILTAEDNERVIRLCLDLTFSFARDPGTSVFFLVAGGRKTMTSCLTLAAQLYGRPQDRIYHVLVSPEFESCPEFWFPPRQSVPLTLHDELGRPYQKETRYARIHLVSIPFVSVRAWLGPKFLSTPQAPALLMQALVRERPKRLVLNLASSAVSYGGIEMDMDPAQLVLYAFFAARKTGCDKSRSCKGCTECFLETTEVIEAEMVRAMYSRLPSSRIVDGRSDTGIVSLSKEDFHSYRSKIRQHLLRTFGQAAAAELEISAKGRRPHARYGLRIDRRRIAIEQ
jgi:CRISPR-associated protein (TIGR02584 family)